MTVDIVVDTREPDDIIPELKDLGLSVKREMLDVGDYLLHDCDDEVVLVSRKAGDLFTSIFDGHFSDELNRCMKFIESFGGGGKLFWLQEGTWSTSYPKGGTGGMNYFKRSGPKWFRSSDNHSGASENVLPNVELSLWAAGIGLLTAGTLHETALMLRAIHQRGQDGWPSKLTSALKRPVLKWSEDSRVQRLMAIWPHLKEQPAIALIHEFQSVGLILDLARGVGGSKNQLLAVRGVGKTGVDNLLEAIQ